MRQVIAGHHGERRNAGGAPTRQRLGQETEHRGGCLGVRQVVADRRQVGEKLAGVVIGAVTAFGDGQGDDARLRRRQPGDQPRTVLVGEQEVADRPHHLDPGVGAVAQLVEGVEIVLGHQRLTHGAVFRAQAGAANAPFHCLPLLEQLFGVNGLMRTVEAADPNVHDALPDPAAVVHGPEHPRRQSSQCFAVEFHRRYPGPFGPAVGHPGGAADKQPRARQPAGQNPVCTGVVARAQAACAGAPGLGMARPLASNRWPWARSGSSPTRSPKRPEKSPGARTVRVSPLSVLT